MNRTKEVKNHAEKTVSLEHNQGRSAFVRVDVVSPPSGKGNNKEKYDR